MTVELPKKHLKYLAKLVDFEAGVGVSFKTVESLIGTLNHGSLHIPGPSYGIDLDKTF
ncbi:hypothetical protein C0995_006488 [Termitomyces sp. Mi166|nr:hypothetical protein C0995_006488 [Termitomyces sp. Mi166\